MCTIRKWLEKDTNTLVLGIGTTIGSLLSYFFFVGHPVWGTNDDVGMSMIAAGVWGPNQPSADLLFIHPFYGWFISSLYTWQPETPWYGTAFIIIVTLSLVTLNFSILRLQKQLKTLSIVIYATIGTILPSLWHLQFTIVSGLSSLAGAILLLSFFISVPKKRLSFIVGISTSLCLLVIGTMIRFQSMLMVGALCTPVATLLFLEDIFLNQDSRYRGFHAVRFMIISIIIGIFLIGVQVYKQSYYKNSSEWMDWFSLHQAIVEFIDYRRIQYCEQTSHLFASVDWDETDYEMIMSWQYVDPVQYAPKKFTYIVDAFQKKSIKNSQIPDFKYYRSYFLKIKNDFVLFFVFTTVLYFCIFTVGGLIIHWEKRSVLHVTSVFCAVFAMYFYLYFGLHRAPFRVLVLLWVCILWIMLLISVNSTKYSTYQTHRWTRYKYTRLKVAAWVLLALFLSVTVYTDFSTARSLVALRVAEQNILENRIKMWNNDLPKNSIIYSIGNSFPYEHHLPLKSLSYFRLIKGFIRTGTYNQSPHQRQVIQDLGLSNDFYASLAQKENVYMVKTKRENGRINALRSHYREKYGLDLLLIENSKLPYLYRMAFKRQNNRG